MEQIAAYTKLQKLVGQDLLQIAYDHEVTVNKSNPCGQSSLNKGWAGQAVERYLGLPINSSRSPNLGSWELKVVPFKKLNSGEIKPKETMAITMLDENEVLLKDFFESHLYTKLNKIIVVARLVEPDRDNSIVIACKKFQLELSEYRDQIRNDYDEIRRTIRNGGKLSGHIGKFIQPRTKGAKNSSSRAFYARKDLIEDIINPKVSTTLVSGKEICSRHAGKDNSLERTPHDSLMRSLPENQSGVGRHKCPYCAYEIGYRDGQNSVLKHQPQK